MEAVFRMVRQVVVFLLLASMLTNLFMGTEYKKYFSYVTSMIVILLVLVPVLGFLGKGGIFEENYFFAVGRQQMEQTKEEIRFLGEKYEKEMKKKYLEQIKNDIAMQCDGNMKSCEVKFDDTKIVWIYVKVNAIGKLEKQLRQMLSVRYGLEEKNIWIEEV